MDTQSFEAIKQKNIPEGVSTKLDAIIGGFEAYAKDGTPYCAEMWSLEEFDELIKLLGIETVRGENILRYHLENTHSGSTRDSEERGESEPFAGEWKLRSMLEAIADMQVWEDRESDYRATLVLRFDDATVLAIGQDCFGATDIYDLEVEYPLKYWVGVWNAKDLDNYPSWRHWQLEFYDVEMARAEKEARDIEYERAQNVTNLSRIKAGDEVTMTMKRLERTPYDTGWYERISEEQLAERFVVTCNVIEAGGYGYIICETQSGEHVRIDGGGDQTTRRQNPMQKSDQAFAPTFGYIYPNQHLMFRDEKTLELSFSVLIVDSIQINPNKEPSS